MMKPPVSAARPARAEDLARDVQGVAIAWRLADVPAQELRGGGGDRQVDQEDRAPAEGGGEDAAQDGSGGQADPRRATPHASARRRSPGSGNAWAISASEHGINAAAPVPWMTRATISAVSELAHAQAALPTANTARPARNPVREPNRSAQRAGESSSAANASVYR